MLVMRLVTIGAVVAASAGIALAQGGTSSRPQAQTKDPEQVICRRVQDTGSLAGGRRECRTRATWDRMAQDARMNNPMASSMSGGSRTSN